MTQVSTYDFSISSGDIARAFRAAGAGPGAVLLFHSSVKSLGGFLEDGPQTLIDGALEAVTPGGTVAVPTLWYNGHPLERREEDFDLQSSPAWNGAVAEAMRRDPRAMRSRHFSHSVSAIGDQAEYLTEGHGSGSPAPSPWSETAFAEISPWSRLYELDALYGFIGVHMNSCTMKHWIESRFVQEKLAKLMPASRAVFRMMLAYERQPGPWSFYDGEKMEAVLDRQGIIRRVPVGKTELMLMHTRPMADLTLKQLRAEPAVWFTDSFQKWLADVEAQVREENRQ